MKVPLIANGNSPVLPPAKLIMSVGVPEFRGQLDGNLLDLFKLHPDRNGPFLEVVDLRFYTVSVSYYGAEGSILTLTLG